MTLYCADVLAIVPTLGLNHAVTEISIYLMYTVHGGCRFRGKWLAGDTDQTHPLATC